MKKICVYCGSSSGEGDTYLAAAEQLADALVARGLGLVYGGASVGTMGALASKVMARGGEVIGIMPQVLMRREIGNDHLTELQVVDSMHQRKAAMAELETVAAEAARDMVAKVSGLKVDAKAAKAAVAAEMAHG